MTHPIVIFTTGIPGSGKSTWAHGAARVFPLGAVKTISLDDIRAMLHPVTGFDRKVEQFVKDTQVDIISRSIYAGSSIIVHNTHIYPKAVSEVISQILHTIPSFMVDFPIEIDEAKRRNSLRIGQARVPDEVIDQMAQQTSLSNWDDFEFITEEEAMSKLHAVTKT